MSLKPAASALRPELHWKQGVPAFSRLALRLGLLFGLEPAFWLGLQMQWDLYAERRRAGLV